MKPHYLCEMDDCDRVKEGNTPYCSTHNHGLRRLARDLSAPKKAPKPLKRTPLKKASPKREEQNMEYNAARNVWLAGKLCACCGDPASDVHHKLGRTNELLLEKKYWLPVCRPCHVLITTDTEYAIKNGYSLSRNKKQQV